MTTSQSEHQKQEIAFSDSISPAGILMWFFAFCHLIFAIIVVTGEDSAQRTERMA
jgi:hypothetical protein